MDVVSCAQLRDEIRQEIRKTLKCPSLDFFYSAELVDREKLQKRIDETLLGTSLSHSISHSRIMGGAAFAADGIGFDLEETSRVSEKVALRVSCPEQVRVAPSASMIFVAQEAAFKALRGPRQPKVVTEVEILEWSKRDFLVPMYDFVAGLKGQQIRWFGVCFQDAEHTIGLCLFPHSSI